MSQYLINHAIQNVWCAPDQDQQEIIQPARVGPAGGQTSRVTINWETVPLPEQNNLQQYWRVFVLGPLPAHIYNLPTQENAWIPLEKVCQDQSLFIHLYTDDGITYPLSLGYLRQIHDGTYVLALRYTQSIPIDFENEDLFVRLYSNAYFRSQRWRGSENAALETIIVRGGVVGQDFTPSQVQGLYTSIPRRDVGHTFFFRNGYLVNSLQANTLTNGESIELIHDRSIKRVEHYSLDDVDAFESVLDEKDKLILYPRFIGETIDYHDDVDFYITRTRNTGLNWKGVLYHKNTPDSVRMLTHNAYAVVDQYIAGFQSANPWLLANHAEEGWDGSQVARVSVYVRHAGYHRELENEASRINELYKLPLSKIRECLSGMNALVPEWRAENLERNNYVRMMDAPRSAIDTDFAADAYGYNAVTQICYPALHTLQGTGDNRSVRRVGEFLQTSVFSYNAGGLLTGVRAHPGGETIVPAPPINQARSVELLADELYESKGRTFYGHTIVNADEPIESIGFRCYVCGYADGFPTEEWRDVTGDSNYYEISENGRSILWNNSLLNTINEYPATRLGGHVWFQREIPFVSAYPGVIEFSLSTDNVWRYPFTTNSEVLMYRPDTVPYGQLEVYMGEETAHKTTLIENVDYYVQWPRIVITKVPPALPGSGLKISVRCQGFCGNDLSRILPRDQGWVRGGLVSANGRYDIRNDRNFKVVVGGKVRLPSQVKFSETDQTGAAQVNGEPYAVVDIIQPVDRLLGRNTETFRDDAVNVDDRVEDYVSQIDPGTEPEDPSAIPTLYRLYEPLVSYLIHSLKDGWMGEGELETDYTINDIDAWIEPFKYFLDFSPILHEVDENYVTVTPHQYDTTMSLTLPQYRFIHRVIINYFDDRIDLTGFVTIED